MALQLSAALASNPRTWPIFEGTAKAEGIEFVPTALHPSEIFWRQLRFADFDISEMSMSSLMMLKASGNQDWVGIPVFTTRRFFHTVCWVRKAAGINSPADLKGKRIGVPEYQQTAALWTRGAFEHEWGIAPSQVEFWMERVPTHSHAGAVAFKAPTGVTINQIPPENSIGTMILSGELDVAICYNAKHTLVDRSVVELSTHPDIKPMFPDPVAEGVRYLARTGLFPINHGMVVRREIYEKHPWIALNILAAFDEANALADRQRAEHLEYYVQTGRIPKENVALVREPIVRHGVNANRKVLETAAQYSLEQGLTPRLMRMEDLFAASTLGQ